MVMLFAASITFAQVKSVKEANKAYKKADKEVNKMIKRYGKNNLIYSDKNRDKIMSNDYDEIFAGLDEMLKNRQAVENVAQMSALQPASSDMNLAEYLASKSTPEEWEALMKAYATYSDAKNVYDRYNTTSPVYKNEKYKDFNILFDE